MNVYLVVFAVGALADPGVNRQKDPFSVVSPPEESFYTSQHPNDVNYQGFKPTTPQFHQNLEKPNEPPKSTTIPPTRVLETPESPNTNVVPSFWSSLLHMEYFNRIAVIFLGFFLLIVLSVFKSIFMAWSIVKRNVPDEAKNPIEDLTKYVYDSIQKFQDEIKAGTFKLPALELPTLPVIFPMPTTAADIPNSIAQYLLNNSLVTYLNNLLQKPK